MSPTMLKQLRRSYSLSYRPSGVKTPSRDDPNSRRPTITGRVRTTSVPLVAPRTTAKAPRSKR